MTKAQAALQQLGGNQFLAMTGARLLVDVGNGLQFRLPKGTTRNRSNLVLVTMSGDTFDMTFYRLHGMTIVNLGHFEVVPGERLADLFTEQTGLDTHL